MLLDFFQVIAKFCFQKHDVSPPCIADIAHFLWTAIDYTRSNERRNCANCTCEFQMINEQNDRWIFNGMITFSYMMISIFSGIMMNELLCSL